MIDMLNFLLENDVVIKASNSSRYLSADEFYVLGGEFVVDDPKIPSTEIYRGTDFETALSYLTGKENKDVA